MSIIQQIIQFITFNREVKDIDYNQSVATALFAANVLINFYGMQLILQALPELNSQDFQTAPLYHSVLQNLINLGLFYALFRIQDMEIRFIQAATAFFGVSVILVPVGVLLTIIPGLQILSLVPFLWVLVCSVRVIMQSLELSVGLSIVTLMGLTLLSAILSTVLLPL